MNIIAFFCSNSHIFGNQCQILSSLSKKKSKLTHPGFEKLYFFEIINHFAKNLIRIALNTFLEFFDILMKSLFGSNSFLIIALLRETRIGKLP